MLFRSRQAQADRRRRIERVRIVLEERVLLRDVRASLDRERDRPDRGRRDPHRAFAAPEDVRGEDRPGRRVAHDEGATGPRAG